jgi:hypothetical protein
MEENLFPNPVFYYESGVEKHYEKPTQNLDRTK